MLNHKRIEITRFERGKIQDVAYIFNTCCDNFRDAGSPISLDESTISESKYTAMWDLFYGCDN
jgi:hypothetical protein